MWAADLNILLASIVFLFLKKAIAGNGLQGCAN